MHSYTKYLRRYYITKRQNPTKLFQGQLRVLLPNIEKVNEMFSSGNSHLREIQFLRCIRFLRLFQKPPMNKLRSRSSFQA